MISEWVRSYTPRQLRRSSNDLRFELLSQFLALDIDFYVFIKSKKCCDKISCLCEAILQLLILSLWWLSFARVVSVDKHAKVNL